MWKHCMRIVTFTSILSCSYHGIAQGSISGFYNKKGIEFEIKNINKKIKTGEIDPFNAASKLFYGNKS